MIDALRSERLKKLDNLRSEGINPFPARSGRSHSIADAVSSFGSLSAGKKKIALVGRIRSIRIQGGVFFFDISDASGDVQCFAAKGELVNFPLWKDSLDIGDFVEVRGVFFKTKRGEKSIRASKIIMLAKSVRPIPVEHFGIKDAEELLRKRYLDMLLSKETRDAFIKRSELVRKIREFLWKEGFVEVETPMLQPIPGGALARPFRTRHNALKQDFYMRIAPELYLKRLLVGGFEKVFELGRIFRNEGIDREHNPEFTMLELYWAYQDYKGLMKFTKRLLRPFIKGAWKEVSYIDILEKNTGKSREALLKMSGSALDELFKKNVRPKLIKPTIVYDVPKSLSPLSKSREDDARITERFQFIIDGAEIVNGFSELNDPIDQRERMEEQEKLYRKGDQEASRMDEDYLEAMEYGMPPAAGLGLGIDRLAAIYAGRKSVKDIILFPTLRRKTGKSRS